jgi:Flp pilus assembly pilin Flp
MRNVLARLITDDSGQDLIEYGLLVGIITAATVTAITAIGPKVADYFGDLDAALPAVD